MDDGREFFTKFFYYKACDSCIRREVADTCKHKDDFTPWWLSPEKADVVYEMLKDYKATLMREAIGMTYEDHSAQFSKDNLAVLVDRPLFKTNVDTEPPLITLIIDPNASASFTSSQMAVVAVAYNLGNWTICGVTQYKPPTDSEIEIVLRSFILELLRHPSLAHAHIAFCPEDNGFHEASWMYRVVNDFPEIMRVSQKGDERTGWRTDEKSKSDQLHAASTAIAHHRVQFLDDWIYKNPMLPEMTRDKMRQELTEQLARYGNQILPSGKATISGCIDSEGKFSRTMKDDLAVAFCMAIGVSEMLFERRVPNFDYSRPYGTRLLNKRKRA